MKLFKHIQFIRTYILMTEASVNARAVPKNVVLNRMFGYSNGK